MSSNNFFKSDLYKIHNIVQASMLVYPKEMIINTLRDFFSKDSYYHYVKDAWGFPNTPDHTDLPPGSGITDDVTTRVYIGENYRFNNVFYPAILVKSGGSKYVPISINREQGGIQYETLAYEDGYGNISYLTKPVSFITAGIWEGSIIIDVLTRSLRSRDDLVELIGMCFSEISYDTLEEVGVVVKPLSVSGPSETDDRNDKLFRQTLTLDIRTEWRREIPVGNIIDAIFFTVQFASISNPDTPSPANLTIDTDVNTVDILLNL
jgi:hypothetical protein